jgi:hypothetical protein
MVDFISHALWAFALFHDFSFALAFVLFSLLPDLLWGVPLVIILIITGKLWQMRKMKWRSTQKQENPNGMPVNFIQNAYHFSHSWLVMALASIIVFVFLPSLALPFVGGVFLHLSLDLFLHKDSISGQMPFYPLSKFKVKGFLHWSDRRFMILNYLLLSIIYILILAYHF